MEKPRQKVILLLPTSAVHKQGNIASRHEVRQEILFDILLVYAAAGKLSARKKKGWLNWKEYGRIS